MPTIDDVRRYWTAPSAPWSISGCASPRPGPDPDARRLRPCFLARGLLVFRIIQGANNSHPFARAQEGRTMRSIPLPPGADTRADSGRERT